VTLKGGRFVNIRLCYLHIFFPIAVETLGAVVTEAMSVLHAVGRRIQFVTHEKRSFSFLMLRLSVAIKQLGNAACIMGSVPHSAHWDELFYIKIIFIVLLRDCL